MATHSNRVSGSHNLASLFTKLKEFRSPSNFSILDKKYALTSDEVVSHAFIFVIISSKDKSLKFIKGALKGA